MADLFHRLNKKLDYAYSEESIAAFLSGGFSQVLLRIVRVGSYDRDYYYNAVKRPFTLNANSHVLEKGE